MGRKLSRTLAIVVAVVSVLASTRPAAAQNVPPDPLSVRMPDDAVGADVELIVSIAARLGLPFGFEAAGALSEGVSMPFSTRGGSSRPRPLVSVRPTPLDVRGVTLRQALDAVVAKDRRYSWREVDGVVVVRPVAAWRDPEHPLLRRELAGTSLFDQLNEMARAEGAQWSLRSEVHTILLDRGRAVTVTEPVLRLDAAGASRTFPLVPTSPPEPRRP
jgi:hypothetical protein